MLLQSAMYTAVHSRSLRNTAMNILRSALLCCAVSMGLIGCATLDSADGDKTDPDPLRSQAKEMAAKPQGGTPMNTVTSFAQALRCMDGVFRNYGVRGVAVVLEEIPDSTGKMRVGAKDMFISATSGMTRASRAISLIPWDRAKLFEGRDEILKAADFAVQGSISQFDETMLRKQDDGAVCLGPLCLGAARSDSFSGLSLDLNMLETRSLTMMPGVTSKNYVLIRRKGKGYDGDLTLNKFGAQYNFVFNTSDGQGQALRTLVELSVIELYGRLLKIPYWSCLGLTEADAGVSAEIDDWWETLRTDVPSLASWLQVQMRVRGLYKGPIDGRVNDDLKRAVLAYKSALDLKEDLEIDQVFFRSYLSADHVKVQARAVQRLAELGPAPGTTAAQDAPAGSAPMVSIRSTRGPDVGYRRGEPVGLEIGVDRDAYLYCFLVDEDRHTTQFFPNPVQPSAAIQGGGTLSIPGRFPFKLVASQSGRTESVACAATSRNLGEQALPSTAGVTDVAQLQQAMAAVTTGQELSMGVFDVTPQ
ncbi:MAG: DUF4384 domain-containing protein [Leptothrix sp. (in: b-proteobacteria)]